MNKAKKDALTKQYMTSKIPPITDFQREWIRKESAHYIFVDRDNNGNHVCHCDRCGKDIDLGKTKHRAKVKCPSCGHELEIIHKWRIKNMFNLETIDWFVIPKAIDPNTLMLRYVFAWRNGLNANISEVARIVFDTRMKSVHYFEYSYISDEKYDWKYSRVHYFTEFNMYNFRTLCCLPAKQYKPTWLRELRRLDCFKYFPDFMDYAKQFYYINDGLKFISYKAPLYEKLEKAGFGEYVKNDFKGVGSLKDIVEYNTREKSLIKMLGLNKTQFKVFRSNQTNGALEYIKLFPNITQEYLDMLFKSKVRAKDVVSMRKGGINVDKTIKYVEKQGCSYYEWEHYVNLLKRLNYNLDEAYLYPKDFRKEDRRVSTEYEEKLRIEREKAIEERRKQLEEQERNQNNLIAKISEGLRNNPEIREFFAGSNGLQIFVPDSVDDLRNEGRNLHNCLGTYVERYASGKTLIFFVRRIDDPTAPYVAMEYCHGRVIQCREDCNRQADSKVVDFAEALASRLRKLNILAA